MNGISRRRRTSAVADLHGLSDLAFGIKLAALRYHLLDHGFALPLCSCDCALKRSHSRSGNPCLGLFGLKPVEPAVSRRTFIR